MNAIVVDTSVWISFFKGKEFPELESALKEGRAFLSPVVMAELLSGSLSAPQRLEFIDFLKELPLVGVDFEHWVAVGELRGKCARKGITISTPDAHVAQCALDLEAVLFSEDRIFEKITKVVKLRIA